MSRYGQVLPGIDALLIQRGHKERLRNRPAEITPLRIVHGPDHWEALAERHHHLWSLEGSR